MDRNIFSSVMCLALASILLATGTLLFSMAVDRTIGLRPNWPALSPPKNANRRNVPAPESYDESLDRAPVDANLRELWKALHQEEEAAKKLKFPIEVEEAMSNHRKNEV